MKDEGLHFRAGKEDEFISRERFTGQKRFNIHRRMFLFDVSPGF